MANPGTDLRLYPLKTVAKVSAALTEADPYAAVAAVFVGPMMEGIVPPEPFGTAQLINDAQAVADTRKLTSECDTLTPMWIGDPTWLRVPLSPAVRLHVELIDDDISNDDPIGTFELNERDFEAALASAHVYHVKVADQTYNQILFAGITVRASSDAAIPSRDPVATMAGSRGRAPLPAWSIAVPGRRSSCTDGESYL